MFMDILIGVWKLWEKVYREFVGELIFLIG